MSSLAAAQFTGDIPRFYDQHLGPVIFEPYAADLARRAAALKPSAVLEIAGGTGVSTVALRAALPAAARIVATDLNQAMLDISQAKFGATTNIEFRQADAMALPFENEAFDLIAIQFGVMFFPDRPAAYAEARRVLKRGGTLLFNVWGAMAANAFAEIANATAIKFFPENPPKFYLVPFGYADNQQVYADLKAGGFSEVSHEVVRVAQTTQDWRHFAQGLIYGNPMIADIQASKTVKADDMVDAIAAQIEARLGPAPAKLPLEATVYAARKT
ncbi:MAG: class I SAM-dependent methyltransferase [Hyphomonadaceae bacterium]|nr:class I SAM-dependent methyltransferase [Hyphomonadaceae bacterium]